MSNFNVYDHGQDRVLSFGISQVLDDTVGEALRRVCGQMKMNNRDIRTIEISITNAMHASIDSAISYHCKGRHFAHWDLLLNFFVKQFSDFFADYLDDHQDHFHDHHKSNGIWEQELLNSLWMQTRSRISTESIALAKALLAPKPPKRTGY